MSPHRPAAGEESQPQDDYALEVGRRIVQARKELSLTQVELARKIGVSQRSAQAYENGEVIPYRHLKQLSRALKRTPEWILHGDQDGEASPEALRRLEGKVDQLTELIRSLTRQ
jgi:transcriptional regulator with XRE-family HTH domain